VTKNKGSVSEREPEKRLPPLRRAAGAQITQWGFPEVVTRNNDTGNLLTRNGLSRSGNWNEHNLNPLANTIGGQVPVPAAAVIPAPIAYIKVVAVEKLVVGLVRRGRVGGLLGHFLVFWFTAGPPRRILPESTRPPFTGTWARAFRISHFEKISVFKAGITIFALNSPAWNDRIGPPSGVYWPSGEFAEYIWW